MVLRGKSMSEYIYCAVNKDGIIQQVCGSSKRTYYFRTDHYLKGAVSYHNHYHVNDLWKVQKFELVAVGENDADE